MTSLQPTSWYREILKRAEQIAYGGTESKNATDGKDKTPLYPSAFVTFLNVGYLEFETSRAEN